MSKFRQWYQEREIIGRFIFKLPESASTEVIVSAEDVERPDPLDKSKIELGLAELTEKTETGPNEPVQQRVLAEATDDERAVLSDGESRVTDVLPKSGEVSLTELPKVLQDRGIKIENNHIIFPGGGALYAPENSRYEFTLNEDGSYRVRTKFESKDDEKAFDDELESRGIDIKAAVEDHRSSNLAIDPNTNSVRITNGEGKVIFTSSLEEFSSEKMIDALFFKEGKYSIPPNSGVRELFSGTGVNLDMPQDFLQSVVDRNMMPENVLGEAEEGGVIHLATDEMNQENEEFLFNTYLDNYFPGSKMGSLDTTMANELAHRFLLEKGLDFSDAENRFRDLNFEASSFIKTNIEAHEFISDAASIATNSRDFFRVLENYSSEGYGATADFARHKVIEIMGRRDPNFDYNRDFQSLLLPAEHTPYDRAKILGEAGFTPADLEEVKNAYLLSAQEMIDHLGK